jgi:hypothetical protein
MKGSKGIRISALLMAMLLVGMAFVPAVSANAEKAEIEKRLKDVKILMTAVCICILVPRIRL